jgi:hypothetical protein
MTPATMVPVSSTCHRPGLADGPPIDGEVHGSACVHVLGRLAGHRDGKVDLAALEAGPHVAARRRVGDL